MNETLWKLVGYSGTAMFAGRWFFQIYTSHHHGKPVFPQIFWLLSIAGSILLLLYFIFGSPDSVGVLSNLFPFSIAAYNLFLDRRSRKAILKQ